jgi:hypothetical protein
MKTIKTFIFTILSVLLLSKVTLAQGNIYFDLHPYIYGVNYEIIYEGMGWHFYEVCVETKKSTHFYINNEGNSPITISAIDISGEGFRLPNNETTITIEPKGTYRLLIECAPIEVGINYGIIKFTHNASNLSSPYSVTLTVIGLPLGTPKLSINGEHGGWNTLYFAPESESGFLTLREITVGTTEQSYLMISNIGTGPLVISSIDVEPWYNYAPSNDPKYYEAFSLPNGEKTITIEPGITYNLIVEFKPTESIGYGAIFVFTHNGYGIGASSSPARVNVAGRGGDAIVSSTDEPEELPTAYSLSQNYPNPFNPTTKIEYSLPEAANVRLAVYNSLGQEVASLLNEYQSIGKYIIDFNANNLPSGIYFYKIQSGNFNKTQKMVLMK